MKSGWIVTGIAVLIVGATAFAVRWINGSSRNAEVAAANTNEAQVANPGRYPTPIVSVAAVAIDSRDRAQLLSRSSNLYGDGNSSLSRPSRHSRHSSTTTRRSTLTTTSTNQETSSAVAHVMSKDPWINNGPNAR